MFDMKGECTFESHRIISWAVSYGVGGWVGPVSLVPMLSGQSVSKLSEDVESYNLVPQTSI